jgi:hypothetical protein
MMEVHQLTTIFWKLTEGKDGKQSTREVDWNSFASISIQAHSTKSVSLALRKEECQTIQRYVISAPSLSLQVNVPHPGLTENPKPTLCI